MYSGLRAKSLELYPSRLKQVVLPSVFHTEDGNILARIYKVDATMADHPFASGPIHFSKDAGLSLGSVVLPRFEVFSGDME